MKGIAYIAGKDLFTANKIKYEKNKIIICDSKVTVKIIPEKWSGQWFGSVIIAKSILQPSPTIIIVKIAVNKNLLNPKHLTNGILRICSKEAQREIRLEFSFYKTKMK